MGMNSEVSITMLWHGIVPRTAAIRRRRRW